MSLSVCQTLAKDVAHLQVPGWDEGSRKQYIGRLAVA